MSLIKFTHNNCTYGIVRNQKCSTTTMMSYVAQALWNANPHQMQTYWTFAKHAPGVYQKFTSFDQYQSLLEECDVRIALWRDPVSKFVSGFRHTMFSPSGAQDNVWIGKDRSLDNFIQYFDQYRHNANVRDHCETNTARLGSAHCLYTHVLEYREVHCLADILQLPKLSVHHRQSPVRESVTPAQRHFIKQIMALDYKNSWC